MKLWRLLSLPGYALSQTARRVCLTLGALMLATGIINLVDTHSVTLHWALHSAHLWAVLNAFLWLFLANTVLLGRDARMLRMPALERDAWICLGLYGAMGIALPAALIGWASGHLLTVIIMLLFGAALGASYALMPAYLSVLVFFADNIPAALSTWFSLPLPSQPGFDAWAGTAVAALWLVLAWRIRGLLRGDLSLQRPHGPLIVLIRSYRLGWGSDANGNGWGWRKPGHGPVWALPKMDLHDCGPGHPVHSLRVALGGSFAPQTWLSRATQGVMLLTGLLFAGFLLLLQATADHADHAHNLYVDLGRAGSVVFFGTLMSAILAMTTVRLLYQRWSRTNGELPLLALLPGLGDAAATKHALLRASLLPALGVQLGLALLLLTFALFMHINSEGEILLLLGPLGSSALLTAFALAVFSADAMSGWGMAAAMGAGYVWICISPGILQFSAGSRVLLGHTALMALAIGWSVFFAASGWMIQRGWRGLQRAPHAFLAH